MGTVDDPENPVMSALIAENQERGKSPCAKLTSFFTSCWAPASPGIGLVCVAAVARYVYMAAIALCLIIFIRCLVTGGQPSLAQVNVDWPTDAVQTVMGPSVRRRLDSDS